MRTRHFWRFLSAVSSDRPRCRDDIAAVGQPLQGFLDFVGWKILLQLAHELPNAQSASAYCGRQCTIELAMKKELPVLGIEAHDIGRQHIDAEIRRELRNVFAVLREAFPVIACHEVSTRNFATIPDRWRKADSPVARAPVSSSRAGVSGFSVSR